MCGVAGLVGAHPDEARGVVSQMLAAIRHRGPDDEGLWLEGGACLGHRRLSIIDTSPAGRQPMVSASGRYVLVLNGEIYNFRELKAELDSTGHQGWQGHSDCEVFLEAIARWGIEAALTKAKGMFAFGLWDRHSQTLTLARDRFGEKPLYFSVIGQTLAFASELSAIEGAPGFPRILSGQALAAYFRFGYVPAPLTIYGAASKLEPGCRLTWSPGGSLEITPFWRLSDVIEAGRRERFSNVAEAEQSLDATLRRVIDRQMISDVPLGVFLSGGVDSALVAAIMQQVSSEPIRTFTLGFDSPRFNEADQARDVAVHLGTRHTEEIATGAQALELATRIGTMFDEPLADASQIPTYLVSAMARKHVKVCLTGDGGDEMFGGYVRYPGVSRLWRLMQVTPCRHLLASAVESQSRESLDRNLAFLAPLARRYASRGSLGADLHRAAAWLRSESLSALFEATITLWPVPGPLVCPPGGTRPMRSPPAFDNAIEEMLWRDTVDYLPGDILCKVDRSAMAHGLETRAPFLDLDIAALAWRTPPALKVRGEKTKILLRRTLARYLPSALMDRPKLGFTPPLHEWLTGALRPWARALLDPAAIRSKGILDERTVETAWRRLEAGDSGQVQRIWSVLVFQAWSATRGI